MSAESVRIVPYSPDFAKAIAEMEREAFGVNAWSEKAIADASLRPDFHFFCAVQNGECVGYLNGYAVLDEFDICNIAVSKVYRREGIAKKLLSAFLSWAEREKTALITLEVRASNEPAVALYRGAGFTLCGTRKAFYSHPTEDALLFEKIPTMNQ